MPTTKDLRIFGYIWGAIFLLVSYLHNNFAVVYLLVSTTFFISATYCPNIYQKVYFYQLWIKFGNFIGHINSKIIIFILFFFMFVPIGLLLKLFRKDLLKKKLDKSLVSYFEKRKTQPGSMVNQF